MSVPEKIPPPTPPPADEPWRAWFSAARDPAACESLRTLYADLDAAVRAKGPTCWTRGKCCNFDAYGHRLYVTGFEIAWVLERVTRDGFPVTSEETPHHTHTLPVWDNARALSPVTNHLSISSLPASCVYQVNNLCSIHAIRPMGCRVFFCQQGTQDWQHELYENFLTRLRAMHDRLALPYRYMEWRAGLIEARSRAAGA